MNKLIATLTLAVGIASCSPAHATDPSTETNVFLGKAFIACIASGNVMIRTADGTVFFIKCETTRLENRGDS